MPTHQRTRRSSNHWQCPFDNADPVRAKRAQRDDVEVDVARFQGRDAFFGHETTDGLARSAMRALPEVQNPLIFGPRRQHD
jgi:hypothetical protein